jgi:hypothetical protein
MLAALSIPALARAQTPQAALTKDQTKDDDDDPATLNAAEPDFNLVGLPTALRLPTFASAFRVTHRFTLPLNQGSFGDLASNLFGLDSGAQIGLEYRFGLIKNGQIGIHRTSNRTIEFFSQYRVLRQHGAWPVTVTPLFTIEGTNNFRDSYSPALGAIVSRTFKTIASVYFEPIWVNNTNPEPRQLVDHNDTFILGIGGRIRIRPTVTVVVEAAPRATGYQPGVAHTAFGIEKRVGGHVFQLNFSNAFGTTLAQIARGGPVENDWYMGFNISRKFY